MTARALDREISAVVRSGSCAGYGARCQLDAGVSMTLDAQGYARPVRRAGAPEPTADLDAHAAHRFRSVCPGVQVTAVRAPGALRHPTMGAALDAWRAWATDPEIRYSGSSGGVLTALAGWFADRGDFAQVVAAAPASADPRRTVSVRIQSRAEALAASGSRYGRASNAGAPTALDPRRAFVGKPCEGSAVRALATTGGQAAPLIPSFLCAGTPSQWATDDLVRELRVAHDTRVTALRYRGEGWPGRFSVRAEDGTEVSTSYHESWGEHLGRTVQSPCKICPDGVGESSDIGAADLWRTDDRGYPAFKESAGVSALLARTERGLRVVEQAVRDGVIHVEPIDLADLAAVQPLQRRRRETVLGRTVAARLAGRRAPRYRGFHLLRLALGNPLTTLRTTRGTFSRVRTDSRKVGTQPEPSTPTQSPRG